MSKWRARAILASFVVMWLMAYASVFLAYSIDRMWIVFMNLAMLQLLVLVSPFVLYRERKKIMAACGWPEKEVA